MPKTLIIVESPTKARTLAEFLGSNFVVESSFGHVRDLPKSKLGIDVEHDFEPAYIIPQKAKAKIKELKSKAEKADTIILATDEDREGEAIAWHLVQALGLNQSNQQSTVNGLPQKERKDDSPEADPRSSRGQKPKKSLQAPGANRQPHRIERIVFHEITKRAITDALAHPRGIDMRLVDAQQARRILDRLVGYKLSPFLWKKVYRGLSAGRVQSPAVRLIVEREREIQKFKPQEYHTISALLAKEPAVNNPQPIGQFEAFLTKINGKTVDKFAIKSKEEAQDTADRLKGADWVVEDVEKKETAKNPLPPYTTSTLQQEAFRRLRFSAKQTMMLAQQLYEGIRIGGAQTGLITYMRTDSVHLSEDALDSAKKVIHELWGGAYALSAPRRFKTKTKGAQEAHEAIRPTDPGRAPESVKEFLDARQYKLYELVWRRFMATQMPAAVFNATTMDILATPATHHLPPTTNHYVFRATGQVMKFDGFLKAYPIKFTEAEFPPLEKGEKLRLEKLTPRQHFTEPPARYTEASLIKTLEQNGIGRPSTYAPIISTIQERKYAERDEKRALAPTDIGFLVCDLLTEHFPEIVDLQFTARIEEDLDRIAQGDQEWRPIIRAFYDPFAKHLAQKYEEVEKQMPAETTDELCEKCGKPMVVKMGRFGKFLACSGFPECKTTKRIKKEQETIGMKCPGCREGDILVRRTKKGRRIFYGCSRYPECDYASWEDPRKSQPPTAKNE